MDFWVVSTCVVVLCSDQSTIHAVNVTVWFKDIDIKDKVILGLCDSFHGGQMTVAGIVRKVSE